MGDIVIEGLVAYILVFIRMGGMVFLNPLFSRRNVPARVRMVFVIALTLLIAPMQDASAVRGYSDLDMLAAMFRELMAGLACAYVFLVFYYLLFFAGDVLDMQVGMSMAKVFDPGTNIQVSVSGNLFGIFFMLYLLATGSHLLLIKIFASSYMIVPLGAEGVTLDVARFAIDLFISAFNLIIRLTLPFVAAEFVLEMAMGVLMKLIPQIHVFVINIQFKVLLGVFMLLAFAKPIAEFLDKYMDSMFRSMEKALMSLMG